MLILFPNSDGLNDSWTVLSPLYIDLHLWDKQASISLRKPGKFPFTIFIQRIVSAFPFAENPPYKFQIIFLSWVISSKCVLLQILLLTTTIVDCSLNNCAFNTYIIYNSDFTCIIHYIMVDKSYQREKWVPYLRLTWEEWPWESRLYGGLNLSTFMPSCWQWMTMFTFSHPLS